jgi:hypothetical protein
METYPWRRTLDRICGRHTLDLKAIWEQRRAAEHAVFAPPRSNA